MWSSRNGNRPKKDELWQLSKLKLATWFIVPTVSSFGGGFANKALHVRKWWSHSHTCAYTHTQTTGGYKKWRFKLDHNRTEQSQHTLPRHKGKVRVFPTNWTIQIAMRVIARQTSISTYNVHVCAMYGNVGIQCVLRTNDQMTRPLFVY